MPFAISPIHAEDDFPHGPDLDGKIEIFIARVEGWLLGPAIEMIKMGIGYRAFALLAIVTSYFDHEFAPWRRPLQRGVRLPNAWAR